METLHVFGDLLCKDNKFSKVERPRVGPAGYSPTDITIDLTAHVTQVQYMQIFLTISYRLLSDST